MSVTTSLIKAAVVQAEPVWFDLPGTVTKTCDLIKDAASKGAKIIAFPELWLPGYPTWIWARPMDLEMVVKYTKNSLKIDSSEMQDIKSCAVDNNMVVCLGFSERSGDSLYVAQCIMNSNGKVVMTRRKLKPFHVERTIFGDGHGPSLDNVALTSVGRVGQLSCGEHFNPLINFNTFSQGEQIHCAAWPCVPAHSGGPEPFSMSDEAVAAISQVYSIQAQCYTLHSTMVGLTALWPERCAGLVSVNSYLIQDLSKAWVPLDAKIEAGFWYFYYFLTPRGQAALAEHPKDIARVVWDKNSPEWNYTEEDLDRATETFVNPDYVSVVTHVYKHRLLYAPGDPDYSDIEKALLEQPVISVPTVTLDGLADGNFPPTNGSSSAKYFSGPRVHHQVPGAGHNLPQEKPSAFVNAVLEVTSLK
ncbi:Uncharacterized protein LW94_6185 [Fusarium fujikuroi]|nr:Uncharacterized protein LW94_6185 [Fusarium fujikuroi]